jgi:predicted acylesterase/phospholipase RssA
MLPRSALALVLPVVVAARVATLPWKARATRHDDLDTPTYDTPHHEEDAARLNALLQAATGGPLKRLEGLVTERTEIDVCISGGALRGYFMLGARHAIENRGDLSVVRYAGTSAGAWTAMFMAAGLSNADWLRTYTLTALVAQQAKLRGKSPPYFMEAYREYLWPWLKTTLPEDAYRRCSGRLFVTITTLEGVKLEKLVVSEFDSNEALFEACAASSCVPMVTQRGFGTRFAGKRAFDGL